MSTPTIARLPEFSVPVVTCGLVGVVENGFLSTLCLMLAACVQVSGGDVEKQANDSHNPNCTELELAWSKKAESVQLTDRGPKYSDPPLGIITLRATAVQVSIPALNSPSIVGETAKVVFTFGAGDLKLYPRCSQVVLSYDPYSSPFTKGHEYTLLFLPDGKFWGIKDVHF